MLPRETGLECHLCWQLNKNQVLLTVLHNVKSPGIVLWSLKLPTSLMEIFWICVMKNSQLLAGVIGQHARWQSLDWRQAVPFWQVKRMARGRNDRKLKSLTGSSTELKLKWIKESNLIEAANYTEKYGPVTSLLLLGGYPTLCVNWKNYQGCALSNNKRVVQVRHWGFKVYTE